MRGIIGVSLKFQFLIITIAVVIIAFGVTQLAKMPIDALPEFSPPYVEVQTEALVLRRKWNRCSSNGASCWCGVARRNPI
jgi:Cu/Ag efflux pump CusA